jgi:hypothetical protein
MGTAARKPTSDVTTAPSTGNLGEYSINGMSTASMRACSSTTRDGDGI